MDYHLDHRLRLRTETEHKGLYSWAINEIDDADRVIGTDQIPWVWDLYFHATSMVMGDSIVVTREQPEGESETTKVQQRQVIRIQLKPGDLRENELFRATRFSMFGTNRQIEKFQLDVRPITDPTEQENCIAWGSPSYTYESDFRHSTTEDIVIFYLAVKPETFSRYADKIAMGGLDEVAFRVGSVRGFYSEWSPGISTRSVKVLTAGSDHHKVEMPPGIEFDPPRLSTVHEADLYFNRRLAFRARPLDEDAATEPAGTVVLEPPFAATHAAPDLQSVKLLGSIKVAAWVIAIAAVVTMLATVF